MTLLVLSLLALAGQLLSALAVWWNHLHTPDVALGAPVNEAPPLLVIVPARNEEHNIAACVASLLASDYPRLLVRVVDDGSTDRTVERARAAAADDPRFDLLPAGDLPPGWLGKNHALWVGARAPSATSEPPWVLFLDADLRVAPTCLARAVAAAERTSADLFTMMPRLEMVSFWEVAAQVLMAQLIVAWLPAKELNDPRHRRAAAIGPFMLFRRTAYERIGGHEAVHGEVVEDLRLAERVKGAGLRLVYMRGIAEATVRMYDSLPAIVRGWSKNFHVALGRARFTAPLVAAGLLFFFAGPWLLGPIAAASGAWPAAMVGLAAAAVAALGRIDLASRYGITARAPWLAPLGAVVVAWIVLASVLRRRIEWKGRPVA
ncbi:MAG: glycosyltransferase [Myxococcales bacterium]|nr:glycosyltransferase [Myxococcales bacterium]